jgi:hypothetical protein
MTRSAPFDGDYTDTGPSVAGCGCPRSVWVAHRHPCRLGCDDDNLGGWTPAGSGPGPQVWALPPSPPPAVAAVRDGRTGVLWRRTIADTWTDGAVVWSWRSLLAQAASLTDATGQQSSGG